MDNWGIRGNHILEGDIVDIAGTNLLSGPDLNPSTGVLKVSSVSKVQASFQEHRVLVHLHSSSKHSRCVHRAH
jgi:hypothetical protein